VSIVVVGGGRSCKINAACIIAVENFLYVALLREI
jgi:hypothetical protein